MTFSVDTDGTVDVPERQGGRQRQRTSDRLLRRCDRWLGTGRKRTVRMALVALPFVAAYLVFVAIPDFRSGPKPSPREFVTGQCIRPNGDGEYRGVNCKDTKAIATILKRLDSSPRYADTFVCPDDTDAVLEVLTTIVPGTDRFGTGGVCVRNLVSPHPGDSGQGGGNLRSGDCVVVGTRVAETPCATGGSSRVIVAVVETESMCPRPQTKEPLKIEPRLSPKTRVLCLQ